MALDPIRNHAIVTVSLGYSASATSITLASGHGAYLPAPATEGAFNLVWWNSTDYKNPSLDPNKEIIRVTARSGDVLTIVRPVVGNSYNGEGSDNVASAKNIVSRIYKMVLTPTRKYMADLQAELNARSAVPSVGTEDATYITDGTADNVQIQEAIDAVNTAGAGDGGVLELKADTFNLAAGLVNTEDNLTIRASSQRSSRMNILNEIFLIEDQNVYGLVESPNIIGSGAFLKGTIDYTLPLSDVANANFFNDTLGEVGIKLKRTNSIELYRSWMANLDVGILLTNGYENKISKCQGLASNYGIVSAAVDDTSVAYFYVDNFYFQASPATAVECGMYLERFGGWIRGCEIVGKSLIQTGIWIRDSYGGFNLLNDINIEAINGIKLTLLPGSPFAQGNYIRNLTIDNPYIQVSTGNCIYIEGDAANLNRVSDIRITNGRRISAGANSSSVGGDHIVIKNAKNITIDANEFYGMNNISNAASLAAIKLENCQNVTIINCKFAPNTGLTTPGYCIDFDSACTKITIIGNFFQGGYSVAPINAGRAGADIIIKDNQGYDTPNQTLSGIIGTTTEHILTSDAQGADIGGSLGLGGKTDSGGTQRNFGVIAGRKKNSTDADTSGYLAFYTHLFGSGLAEWMRIVDTGNIGMGLSVPTARLHIAAGGTAAGSSSLKINAGSVLTSPEAGAIEFDGTRLYVTSSVPTRRTLAFFSDKLSVFAATSSSELAGVISDETGSGALVFATSPTLVTPILGVAAATSINKVAITAPATSATLTIADGKTLTISNSLTFAGTDASTLNIGTGGTLGTAAYTATTAYEVPLTFSTGLTRTTNTITANLATGVSGGQSVIGGTGSGETLTLSSTAHATKGNIVMGSSAYDEANNRLGLLTTAPTHSLTIGSTAPSVAIYNTADQTTNYERILMGWGTVTSNTFDIRTGKGGTGTGRDLRIGTTNRTMLITEAGSTTLGIYNFACGTAGANVIGMGLTGSVTASSGVNSVLAITPTITQTSTGGYTALLINVTESSTGSGVKRLLSIQVGGADKVVVTNDGLFFPLSVVTASAPAYVKGAIYFDTTLNKLRVGGATAWETITSV